MTWRTEDDPIEQVAMLGVLEEVLALNWDRERVDGFLDDCKDADEAIKRIKRADKQRDPVRFMSRGVIAGKRGDYVGSHVQALDSDAEPVSDAYLETLKNQNNAKDDARRMERHQARKQLTLAERLHLCEVQSERQSLPARTQRGAIERQLERWEKRLDKV